MFQSTTQVRVRYGETDQMGYLYYGFYAWYYEVGRVEALRELGVRYRDIENDGTLLVVAEMNAKYLKPAKYDELITIRTLIEQKPKLGFIHFKCELLNESDDIVNIGKVKIICVQEKTRQRTAVPKKIINALSPYFDE